MKLDLSLFDKNSKQIISKTYSFLKKELKKKSLSPAHKIDHYERVFNLAMRIIKKEKRRADPLIVGVAALLHDIGELRSFKSKMKHVDISVKIARKVLRELNFPSNKVKDVIYAIETHSFTKGHIKPKTFEAQVLQDADRLDALGAIGLARCLMPAGVWDRALYNPKDPFAKKRKLNDIKYTIDHFFTKLLKLPSLMNTKTGRKIARRRVKILKEFLKELRKELKECGI